MAFAWAKRLIRRITGSEPPIVSVLRLSGAIGMSTGFRRGLALSTSVDLIAKLFADKTVAAAAVVINSPGGSPVQAAFIHDRIRALAKENGVKVLTFAEDVAASGGYMLAIAGDEIYAHENSIVGSIGVVSAGFGFDKLIEKIGIERRVHTAGDHKAMLDPFKPENPRDAAHLEALQVEVHESFKAMVRTRREGKLKGDEKELFSGAFWTGAKAKEMGLIDGLGDLRSICRAKFGDKVEFRVVTPRKSWFSLDALASRGPQAPAASDWAQGLIGAVEERALWSRFGL
ncbi:MAG: S49 family peptidase [Alphaproteobacteria bacterium]|nr:S49 family peptidase [Alphaproteobacteria bacterium]